PSAPPWLYWLSERSGTTCQEVSFGQLSAEDRSTLQALRRTTFPQKTAEERDAVSQGLRVLAPLMEKRWRVIRGSAATRQGLRCCTSRERAGSNSTAQLQDQLGELLDILNAQEQELVPSASTSASGDVLVPPQECSARVRELVGQEAEATSDARVLPELPGRRIEVKFLYADGEQWEEALVIRELPTARNLDILSRMFEVEFDNFPGERFEYNLYSDFTTLVI
uniref:Kinesin motor domain-containing protein n=1 Tax=Macrostomum lignano TaxID=282301 RepID=A0A1I8FLH2_9PLAT